LEVISQIENERKAVLLVGHNPGIEELLMLLAGESKKVPTGALMKLELKSSKWTTAADKRAKLAWLIKPRKLAD
jgi:phosphohistidine phosphatase